MNAAKPPSQQQQQQQQKLIVGGPSLQAIETSPSRLVLCSWCQRRLLQDILEDPEVVPTVLFLWIMGGRQLDNQLTQLDQGLFGHVKVRIGMVQLRRKVQRIHADALQSAAAIGGAVVVMTGTAAEWGGGTIDSQFVCHVKERQGLAQHERRSMNEAGQSHVVQEDGRIVVEKGRVRGGGGVAHEVHLDGSRRQLECG